MDSWVTIKTATYPHELMVIKSILESAQIQCFIKDSNIVQINPLYSNMVGGCKLQVSSKDTKIAIEILNENGYKQEVLSPNFIWKAINKLYVFFRGKSNQ